MKETEKKINQVASHFLAFKSNMNTKHNYLF